MFYSHPVSIDEPRTIFDIHIASFYGIKTFLSFLLTFISEKIKVYIGHSSTEFKVVKPNGEKVSFSSLYLFFVIKFDQNDETTVEDDFTLLMSF